MSDELFLSVGELRELPEHEKKLYEVWDEEKQCWVDYKESCYAPKVIGFPDAALANQEIMSISVKQFGANKKFFSLGTKPLLEYDNPNGEYIQCKDEKELIVKFIRIWKDINPQILTGWNIDGFDIPYLINRIKRILGEEFALHLSPFKGKVRNNKRLITQKVTEAGEFYQIFGITIFDYIELYKKYNLAKQESYKLDHIGEVEIGQRKVNFDEYGKSLMRLYDGDIIVDMKSKYEDLDFIMKHARVRELAKIKLAEYGWTKDFGDFKDVIDVDTFDLDTIDSLSNDELKGIYNYCDDRVKVLSYKKFIQYNEQDANIVELIDNKMKFIRQAIRVAHMTKSTFKEIFGTVSPWDNMLYSRLLNKNRQIPPRESNEKTEKYSGAYVKDPILGYHKWVTTVDLTSLYPSIIRMINMSPETLRKSRDANAKTALFDILNGVYDTGPSRSKGWATAANGAAFDQSFTGVIPDTMKYLMEERNIVKTKMKDVKNYMQHILKSVEYKEGHISEFSKNKDYQKSFNRNSSEFKDDDLILALSDREVQDLLEHLESQISMLDATQMALKILANSGYGAIGNDSFRYFREEIAEAITATGQLALRYMSRVLDDFLNEACGTKDKIYAIYGDTDSIFICLDGWVKMNKFDESDVDGVISKMDDYMANVIEPLIAENYDKLSDYLGAKENLLIMKREALSDATIFRGKKNYIMQVYDMEHVRYTEPYLKMMGVETAKSSTPKIIRQKLEECFKLVINKDTRTAAELKEMVDKFREEFDNVPVLNIASPRGISDIDKWVNQDGEPKGGCPIHVRAAINYNNFIKADPKLKRKYEEIKNGTKIKFIKLKEPNIIHSHVVAFIDDLPEEMELEKYIDRKTQFENTFMGPLESFTNLVDWDVRRTVSLSDLFEDDSEEVQQFEALAVDKKKNSKSKPNVVNREFTLEDLFG